MNWGRGLHRLNLAFLVVTLVITILVNYDREPARLGEAIGYYFVFLLVWIPAGYVLRWIVTGFRRDDSR